jgi:hypothetical protein
VADKRTRLERLCRGGLHVDDEPHEYIPYYRQQLQLFQPKPGALVLLAQMIGVHLNYVEIALDLTFNCETDRDDAADFFRKHFLKKWHRGQRCNIKGQTFYSHDERQPVPNLAVEYHDRHSKVTGEICCVHIEWRIFTKAALRRAGIECVGNLLTFNQRDFWSKRLLLYDLDFGALGRTACNAYRGTRRRQWLARWWDVPVDLHLRTGLIIWRGRDTVQEVVDDCGSLFNVRRCLIAVDVSHLLPL